VAGFNFVTPFIFWSPLYARAFIPRRLPEKSQGGPESSETGKVTPDEKPGTQGKPCSGAIQEIKKQRQLSGQEHCIILLPELEVAELPAACRGPSAMPAKTFSAGLSRERAHKDIGTRATCKSDKRAVPPGSWA